MLTYKESEEQVFQFLQEKRRKNHEFTFSVRQNSAKGAETDYFIGTEKSGYFGLTFWTVPTGYPGSAADLIDVFFILSTNSYSYYFEFAQTKEPWNKQNEAALELILKLKPVIKNKLGLIKETEAKNKIEAFRTKSPKEKYDDIEELLEDFYKDLETILPIVKKGLKDIKADFPEFIGHQITEEEFGVMIKKLSKRLIKHGKEVKEPVNKQPDISPSLNRILFGPPGTGKTYNTVNKALEIIHEKEEEDLDWTDREKVKELFDKRLTEGRIVFTTFHQSMSYEDFIEGIKPETIENSVVYNIQDGIFKILCNRALFSFYINGPSKTVDQFNKFDILYDSYIDNLSKRCLDQQPEKLSLKQKADGYNVEVISIEDQTIRTKGSTAVNEALIKKEKIGLLYNEFKNIEDIKRVLDIRTVGQGLGWSSNYWAVFNDFKIFEKEVFEEKITYKEDQRKRYSDQKIKENLNSLPDKYNISFNKADIPRYVLIIDEINRGNVSQIFGELITLIEEDKRLGKTERLKITLPYSKEKFGVPPNVYILGTMNTADRSVEALDTALRRRFCFEEMAPNPELIASEGVLNKDGGILDGINLPKLLRVINLRIEKLLDKDHQIGHSYFMNISDLDGLKGAFQKSIIPLLQEYFYGDYGKIGLVLGKGFIRKKNWDNKIDSFADFPSESSYDFDDKDVYQIIDYSDKGLVHEVKIGDKTIEMNFMKAIKLLMKEAIE